MNKILLIEDDATIGESIKEFLELQNVSIDWVQDGKQGKQHINTYHYDLYLFDIMVPYLDGQELCKIARNKSETPIIMITAKSNIHDKEASFTSGADDYMVKPFALEELRLRIKALRKRTLISDIYRRKDIEIDLANNILKKKNKEIHLTQKEWQILSLLGDIPGMAVQRATLIEEIWGEEELYRMSRSLDVFVAGLRKKIGKDFIATVNGVGYKIPKSI